MFRQLLKLLKRDRIKSFLGEYAYSGEPVQLTEEKSKPEKQPLTGVRYAGLSNLQITLQTLFTWSAAQNLTGAVYPPISQGTTIRKQALLGTANLNNTAGGADQIVSFQQGVAANSSATINAQGFLNILQQTINVARVKGMQLRLLSAADDATITPAPTNTSTATITNYGNFATPLGLYFGSKGAGLTINVVVLAGALNTATINTAGSGYIPSATFAVAPLAAGGSGGVVSITTNTSGVPTSVAVSAGGAGYTNTAVPVVELGSMSLSTGDSRLVLDSSALGLPVSNTSRNFQLYNNDVNHAVTLEISFPVGST